MSGVSTDENENHVLAATDDNRQRKGVTFSAQPDQIIPSRTLLPEDDENDDDNDEQVKFQLIEEQKSVLLASLAGNSNGGGAALQKKSQLKPQITHVTKRDGTVVQEQVTANGHILVQGVLEEKKDMSYLEEQNNRGTHKPTVNGMNDTNDNISSPPRNQTQQRLLPDDMPLDPNAAWRKIQDAQVFLPVPTSSHKTHNTKNYTRIVCMSDTHGKHDEITLPAGDILLHAGDLSSSGETKAIQGLMTYFKNHLLSSKEESAKEDSTNDANSNNSSSSSLFRHVVCIAGNHDITLDADFYEDNWHNFHRTPIVEPAKGRQAIVELVDKTKATTTTTTPQESKSSVETTITTTSTTSGQFHFLEDASCEIPLSDGTDNTAAATSPLNIYGSPWSPEFFDWAYNVPRGQASWDIWAQIPGPEARPEATPESSPSPPASDPPASAACDILVTHGPPLGRGDLCHDGARAGCHDLLWHVQERVRPRLHVFGHIHEGHGTSFDGHTLYVNACNLNLRNEAVQPCIVVDLPHDTTQPARVVQPSACLLQTVEDFLAYVHLHAETYPHLRNALPWQVSSYKTDKEDEKSLPLGPALLDMATAYQTISEHIIRTHTMFPPLRKLVQRDLRKFLSAIYAESIE